MKTLGLVIDHLIDVMGLDEDWKKLNTIMKAKERIKMKRLHEYQIHELYNRMVRLWGNLEINDFYNILDQEGYYDLKTY